jgi:hypothetical protein
VHCGNQNKMDDMKTYTVTIPTALVEGSKQQQQK